MNKETNYSNEFLAGLYAAYYGCKVVINDEILDKRLYSLDIEECESALLTNTVEAKPALRPLSQITDEDAIAVANMLIYENSVLGNRTRYVGYSAFVFSTFKGDQHKIEFSDRSFDIDIYIKSDGDWCRVDTYTSNALLSAIDFLRSKGYNLPYSGWNNGEFITVDPIEAGLAIDITTIKK